MYLKQSNLSPEQETITVVKSSSAKKNRIKNILFPNDYKKDHFKALDGLRGFAVLLVLLSHTSNGKAYMLPGFNFSSMGKVGVYLFFVLSAYLLDRQIIIGFINTI